MVLRAAVTVLILVLPKTPLRVILPKREVSNFTVWKFHDFSITQILREINFGDSRSAKSAMFNTLLQAHNLYS